MDRLQAALVFVRIAELGSLSAAAAQLDMSRAMVTRYLAQMEAWAGARLLHRSTRRLSLTEAGQASLQRCRELLAIAEQMRVSADQDPEQPQGLLRISSSQTLAESALAPAVTRYLQRYPRTAIDLQISDRTVNLVEERIDLAVRISNTLDPNLIARPLGVCASVICAAPAYLQSKGQPLRAQDLSLHNCLTYSYFGKSLWQLECEGEELMVPVAGNLSANEAGALLKAAVAGAGIALLPLSAANPFLRSGQLQALLKHCKPQDMGIYGVYASRQHLPATLRTLLDFLVDWFAHDPQWLNLNYTTEPR